MAPCLLTRGGPVVSAQRGLKTMALRMRQQQSNCMAIAQWLQAHTLTHTLTRTLTHTLTHTRTRTRTLTLTLTLTQP